MPLAVRPNKIRGLPITGETIWRFFGGDLTKENELLAFSLRSAVEYSSTRAAAVAIYSGSTRTVDNFIPYAVDVRFQCSSGNRTMLISVNNRMLNRVSPAVFVSFLFCSDGQAFPAQKYAVATKPLDQSDAHWTHDVQYSQPFAVNLPTYRRSFA